MIKTDNSKVNIELLAENERLREQLDAKREAWSSNNQFKAEIVKLREQLDAWTDCIRELKQRDIEQQIKGVEDLKEEIELHYAFSMVSIDDIIECRLLALKGEKLQGKG